MWGHISTKCDPKLGNMIEKYGILWMSLMFEAVILILQVLMILICDILNIFDD